MSSKRQKRYQSLAQPSSIQTIDTNELQETKRGIWRKQFVLDHFSIPGKYQKFFTGRLRKREQKKYERQLMDPIARNSLLSGDKGLNRISSHAGGRNVVTLDEELQLKKMEMLRAQILRILERHLASEQLPVKQLSLQYWEITDVSKNSSSNGSATHSYIELLLIPPLFINRFWCRLTFEPPCAATR